MFIKIGMDRRINLKGILEYKPYEKHNPMINNKTYYHIKLKFFDGEEEHMSFINDKKERDNFLNMLDENLLIIMNKINKNETI